MGKSKEIEDMNPFKVPENYFEDVSRIIIIATTGLQESGIAKDGRTLIVWLRPVLVVAASIALFILIGYTAIKIFTPTAKDYDLPEISLQEFSDSYFYDIDNLFLEENADIPLFYNEIDDISDDDLIEYLLLDNIELDEIYELL